MDLAALSGRAIINSYRPKEARTVKNEDISLAKIFKKAMDYMSFVIEFIASSKCRRRYKAWKQVQKERKWAKEEKVRINKLNPEEQERAQIEFAKKKMERPTLVIHELFKQQSPVGCLAKKR